MDYGALISAAVLYFLLLLHVSSSSSSSSSPKTTKTSQSPDKVSLASWNTHILTLLYSPSIFNFVLLLILVAAAMWITALLLLVQSGDYHYHHHRLLNAATADRHQIIALDRRHKKRLLSSVPLIRNSNLRVLLRRIHGGRGGYKELADAGYGEEEEEEERGRFVRGEHHDDDDDEESRLKKQLNELEGVMEYKDAHEAEKAQIAELENAIRETDDGDQREALIHKLHELKNAGAEYRQQKTHRRERATPSKQQTEEEIRTSRGVLPSYDPFSKMFEQHKQQAARDDEIDDEDAQTEGLTDIEADPSLIRREWNVPDEPLPPPDEPPSDEGEDALGAPTTALEKLQEEMEKEEEEEFEKSSSNYAGPLSFRPLPKQQPYEAPDFATILNAPEYTGKRRRGGKQVRMKELHTRKSQRFQEKNRAKSDARKVQKILKNKYGRS